LDETIKQLFHTGIRSGETERKNKTRSHTIATSNAKPDRAITNDELRTTTSMSKMVDAEIDAANAVLCIGLRTPRSKRAERSRDSDDDDDELYRLIRVAVAIALTTAIPSASNKPRSRIALLVIRPRVTDAAVKVVKQNLIPVRKNDHIARWVIA
jgi:hypothetical protein